jgi:chromosome segregation ATPase
LSDAGRAQLQRILDHKRQIAAADNALKTMQTQIDELVRDQGRIRENIASLNRVSGQQEQVQKYSRELAAQEAQLASLRDQQSELRKKKAALESELGAMIEKLEF